MPQQSTIREMYAKGIGVTEIARVLKVDRKTVYRYINQADFSPKPPVRPERASKLDPYKGAIEGWLEDDRGNFPKQRHTVRRIKERLEEEYGFVCPYGTVSDYVRKKARRPEARRQSLDLVWQPGCAQADFAQADCVVDGEKVRCHYLVLSFPFSNMGFAQVFLGETGECFCEGLQDIFCHVGGVPPVIVFDNATGIGQRVRSQFVETDLFSRFRAHMGFEARYCSPDSGQEKGSVERKVAFLRTELFVPVPSFDDIEAFNAGLLGRCAFQEAETHYAKHVPQGELFARDCAAMLSLPAKRFEAVRFEVMVADGWGNVRIEGRHTYSSVPGQAGTDTIVGIGAHTVTLVDMGGNVLAAHRRRFGKQYTESIDATCHLRLLASRPGGWRNSRLRDEMPAPVVAHLDALGRDALRRNLRLLADAAGRSGPDATLGALGILASEHAGLPDFFQVGVLAARIAGFGLDTEPIGGADLSCYDTVFLGGGTDGDR